VSERGKVGVGSGVIKADNIRMSAFEHSRVPAQPIYVITKATTSWRRGAVHLPGEPRDNEEAVGPIRLRATFSRGPFDPSSLAIRDSALDSRNDAHKPP
jgi:hypothetical protein